MKKTATQQTEEKSKYKFIVVKYQCTKCGHTISIETDLKNTLDKSNVICECGCKKFKTIGETV